MRVAYSEQLSDLAGELAAMCGLAEIAMQLATQSLLQADLPLAEQVIEEDERIDELRAECEEKAFALLALQAPVAGDLRALVSAIKIIADVERSADLCVNICKAARRIYSHELDSHLRGIIQKCGSQASLLFKEATEAYLNNDGVRAAALHDMDAYLDDLHRQFIQVIFESHAAGNIDLQVAVQLAVVARFYERIGDHAVNVGERTRYIVDGWIPETPYAESHNVLPGATDTST